MTQPRARELPHKCLAWPKLHSGKCLALRQGSDQKQTQKHADLAIHLCEQYRFGLEALVLEVGMVEPGRRLDRPSAICR